MARLGKYYILRLLNEEDLKWKLREFDLPQRQKIEKRLDVTKPYLLIEKTMGKGKHDDEILSNLWTIDRGTALNWETHTKGRLMFDYSGVINPIIHLKGQVFLWDDYKTRIAAGEKPIATAMDVIKKQMQFDMVIMKHMDEKKFENKWKSFAAELNWVLEEHGIKEEYTNALTNIIRLLPK